jgi:hypothetical protein
VLSRGSLRVPAASPSELSWGAELESTCTKRAPEYARQSTRQNARQNGARTRARMRARTRRMSAVCFRCCSWQVRCSGVRFARAVREAIWTVQGCCALAAKVCCYSNAHHECAATSMSNTRLRVCAVCADCAQCAASNADPCGGTGGRSEKRRVRARNAGNLCVVGCARLEAFDCAFSNASHPVTQQLNQAWHYEQRRNNNKILTLVLEGCEARVAGASPVSPRVSSPTGY